MINYNLAIFENLFPGQSVGWMWAAIILFIVIAFSFAIGNMISVKLLKPQFKNAGRIFYGALIWLCTNIVLTLIMFQIKPWSTNAFAWSFFIIFIIVNLVWFFFEVKYHYDFQWGKALMTIIPFIIASILLYVQWLLFPSNSVNISIFVVVNLFAFYLVTKYLFDYDWGKAVIAVIIPLVVATIIIGILWFAIPGDWVKTALFPSNINLLIW